MLKEDRSPWNQEACERWGETRGPWSLQEFKANLSSWKIEWPTSPYFPGSSLAFALELPHAGIPLSPRKTGTIGHSIGRLQCWPISDVKASLDLFSSMFLSCFVSWSLSVCYWLTSYKSWLEIYEWSLVTPLLGLHSSCKETCLGHCCKPGTSLWTQRLM